MFGIIYIFSLNGGNHVYSHLRETRWSPLHRLDAHHSSMFFADYLCNFSHWASSPLKMKDSPGGRLIWMSSRFHNMFSCYLDAILPRSCFFRPTVGEVSVQSNFSCGESGRKWLHNMNSSIIRFYMHFMYYYHQYYSNYMYDICYCFLIVVIKHPSEDG